MREISKERPSEREREIWVGEERKIERQGGREKDRNGNKLGKKEGERDRLEVKERKIERETEAGEREREREISRFIKIKNIKKQNLLYGCFKNDPHKR